MSIDKESDNLNRDLCDTFLKEVKTRVRGADPENLQEKCLEICQTFLPSYWRSLTVKDIEVERLTGGLTNQIYRCKALTTNGVEDNETQEVVIRFNGEKYDMKTSGQKNIRFYDGLVSWMASSEGLGPKMYGLFEGGQVLRYYKHRLMDENDLGDQETVNNLTLKLAKFHYLDAPLERNNNSIERFLTEDLDQFIDNILSSRKPLFEEYNCKTFLDIDMKAEILWLTKRLAAIHLPQVLMHWDFRLANILMTEDSGLVLSDFDFSSYGTRGWDFAIFFSAIDSVTDTVVGLKDEQLVRQFIACYVKHCQQLYGKEYSDNKLNTVEHILIETKIMMLCVSMILTKALFHFDDLCSSQQESIMIANHLMNKYFALKSAAIMERLI